MTLHTLDRHALNGRTPFAQVVRTTVGGQPVAAIHVGHGVWHQTSPEPLTDPERLIGATRLMDAERVYQMAARADRLQTQRDAANTRLARINQIVYIADRAGTVTARGTAWLAIREILAEDVIPFPEIVCPDCEGTGMEIDGHERCVTCGGAEMVDDLCEWRECELIATHDTPEGRACSQHAREVTAQVAS